jgi:site-specific DNA-cytosine methylase
MGKHRIPFVLFENVPELVEAAGGNNIQYFVSAVRALGYECAYRIFEATQFGIPQKRRRTFGICAEVEHSGLSHDECQLMCERMMQLVESLTDSSDIVPLSSFLLHESDQYLKAELQRLLELREKGLEKEDMSSWRNSLLDLCRQKGVDFEKLELPAGMASAPGIQGLRKREKKGLALYMQTTPDLSSLDVAPTLIRMTTSRDKMLPTILPGSKIILIAEKRPLLGIEALAVQGFSASFLKEFASSPACPSRTIDSFFMDLAGNAWSGPCMLALFVAVLTRCTEQHVQQFGAKSRSSFKEQSAEADDVLADILSM